LSAPESQRVARTVQQAISIGEVVSVGVLNLVRSTLVTAVAGARDVSGELGVAATAAVRASIRAAGEVGGDLGLIAKQAIKGTIEATQEIGGDVGLAARSAARGAVKTADEVGGDVAKVANRAVEGVIEAAREIGGDVGSLARNAVEGAIEAADRIGSAAGRSVRSTLSQAVVGIRSLVGALERPGGPSPALRRAVSRRSAPGRKRSPAAVQAARGRPRRGGRTRARAESSRTGTSGTS
jgi:hypothetical protein